MYSSWTTEGLSNWSGNLPHLSHVLFLCPSSPVLSSLFSPWLPSPPLSPLSSSPAALLWLRTKLTRQTELKLWSMDILTLLFILLLHAFAVSRTSCPSVSTPPGFFFWFMSRFHLYLCLTGWSGSSPHPFILSLFTIWAQLCCVMVVHWLTYSLPSSPSPPLTLCLSGRSALHWACSVNHLSLTRTLIRYGAAVDLQDNKVRCWDVLHAIGI